MPTNLEVIQEITKVSIAVAHIEEHMIRQDELTLELAKAIKGNGNGKPGLISDVGKLRTDLDAHLLEACNQKAEKKEKSQKWDGRSWSLFVAVLLLFLGEIVPLIFK